MDTVFTCRNQLEVFASQTKAFLRLINIDGVGKRHFPVEIEDENIQLKLGPIGRTPVNYFYVIDYSRISL